MIADKNYTIKAIYDNGSSCSLINEKIVKILRSELINNKTILKTINGVDFCKNRAKIHLKIGKIEDTINAIVVRNDNFNYDLLLGLDTIKKFKLLQDEKLQIKQKYKNEVINIEKMKNEERQEINTSKDVQKVNNDSIENYLKEELNHLDQEKRQKMEAIINECYECFAKDKFDVGLMGDSEAQIKLKEDKFISKKPYRCSFPDRKEIESQISKLLEHGMIEESNSPFASPVTLAFKKEDGRKTRLCVDYRELNKIVVPEAQPFPRIEDLMENVSSCKWFTAVDINSAFWSIPIRLKDRKKTAFITQKGHWQWKVLPFGYKNSPAVFQRTLARIIKKYNLEEFCVNYIDDMLIFSKTFEEHLEHIQSLFEAIKKEGFKLKLKKCNFAKHSIKFLGHIIKNGKVQPMNDNLHAIKEFERPKNKKMVRQILGKINFYRKFIDHCTQRLSPLHNLLKKNVEFKWTEDCEKCFNDIKTYLCSTPILAIYDREKDIVIEVDASREGLGAVIKQTQEDGILHPIEYFSKKLTPNQTKKEIIYLECLAIKEAILYWQYYLIGKEFIVTSDHKPLLNLRSKSRTDEALGDLILYLSQYNFKIIYKKGKENIEADALSRNPTLESFENGEDCLKLLNMIQLEEIIEDQIKIKNEIENAEHTEKEGNINFKIMNDRKRIYISKEFGIYLINKIHKFYGHIGNKQIAEKLRPCYYFKSMDKIINEYCKNCEICIRNKSRKIRPIGQLSKLGPAKIPFEIMSIDTIGGLGGYGSTKKYLHLLVDHFTRYAWISTSKEQTTEDFIKLIDSVARKNKIKKLLVDQFGAFHSAKFKQYVKENNIELIFTSVDNPQSNGLNERLNQTLINRIRCKLNEDDQDKPWTKLAEICTEEYNKTRHTSTKFEPAYLLKGETTEIIPVELQHNKNLEEDRIQALKNSEDNFMQNKRRIDRNRKDYEFKEGDLVYIESSNKLNRKKLDEIRKGPFKIIKRISKTIYEVKDNKKNKGSNQYHSNKLIPYSFNG